MIQLWTLFAICNLVIGKAPLMPLDVARYDSIHRKLVYEQQPLACGIHTNKDACSRVEYEKGNMISMGQTLPDGISHTACAGGGECYNYDDAKLILTSDGHCLNIQWTTTSLKELKDCVSLRSDHWYGGGQQFSQPWPIEKLPVAETPYVTRDMLQNSSWFGSISERYWISSSGIAVKVSDNIPLHVSLPDLNNDGQADQLCLSSKYVQPFATEVDSLLSLDYSVCFAKDVREVHELTFPKFYDLPMDIPDERMIAAPIWSTWAEFHQDIDQNGVMKFANSIIENEFNNSQIEIDDFWETCYGDLKFNPHKFPNPKAMVNKLHSLGFRVTLWIHPFINSDCQMFATAHQNGYFLKDLSGIAQLTSWWRGNSSGYIDFTNEAAVLWWTTRLIMLQEETGIDSFKFDAGETNWMPENYVLSEPKYLWPNIFSTRFVDVVTSFGKQIEVRTGHLNQRQPIFTRMLDKKSIWGYDNGLKTLIPSLLHSGVVGYPFCLPDMVGGDGIKQRPPPELFIRWAQANTFMPGMQFSILPWTVGDGTYNVTQESKKVEELRKSFSPVIIKLAKMTSYSPAPIARPTWWLCPTEEKCLLSDQQFLLGDDILVAPVTDEGATTKDVVIPPGTWKREDTGEQFSGPETITLSHLTIESNVYFSRVLIKNGCHGCIATLKLCWILNLILIPWYF